MSSAYLLIALLLLQPAAPAGQAKPSAPVPSAPVEKKKLGPPAGTPGRAARLLIIVSAADSIPSGDPVIREAENALAAALRERGATVLQRASLTPAQSEMVFGQSGAIPLRPPDAAQLRALNVDGVIYAEVAVGERTQSTGGLGGLGGLGIGGQRRTVESRVNLRLVGTTGEMEASTQGRDDRRVDAGLNAGAGAGATTSAAAVDGVKAAAADGLSKLLTNFEIVRR